MSFLLTLRTIAFYFDKINLAAHFKILFSPDLIRIFIIATSVTALFNAEADIQLVRALLDTDIPMTIDWSFTSLFPRPDDATMS